MVNSLSNPPDFSSLAEVTVLPDTVIDQAVRRCQQVTDADEQWGCYLRSLALAGVRHWLEVGSIPFTIRLDDHRPATPTSYLQVNGWRVGVAIVSSLPSEAIFIPQSATQGNEPVDLWLLVAVQEELGQIQVLNGLEHRHVEARATVLNSAGEFVLPLSAFTLPPNRVLFYLHHLPAWQVQTELQRGPSVISQTVINAGRWLNNQLDEMAQQWGWRLLEPLTPVSDFRSPTQELGAILQDVTSQGLTVPTEARAAFTEVAITPVPLRFYALTWSSLAANTPEWSLLVFLGPAPGVTLPTGLRLRIRDDAAVLVDEQFDAGADVTYLYGQVLGSWDETFTVEVLPPQATEPLALPPFSFQPEV